MTAQPRTVLIVEDDDDVRQMLAEFLETKGLVVVQASQGESAIDMMDHGYEPSCIVSDINMPIMDGTSFLKIVHERYPEVPFVIVTGSLTADLAVKVKDLGVVEIFEKPCEMARLGSVVAHFVRRV